MIKIHAFSLIEILVTLAVISIILIMTLPTYHHFIQTTEAKITASELLHAINVARNEAILKSNRVVLVKDQEWNKGFVIKMENRILHEFHVTPTTGIIYWRSFPYYHGHLEFLPTGVSNIENGTFWFCLKEKQNPLWAIVLNQSGRAREVLPDANGKIYDSRQAVITCFVSS